MSRFSFTLKQIIHFLTVLRLATASMPPLASKVIIQEFGADPFLILISCLLSLRTRDPVTIRASRQLFAQARTVQEVAQLEVSVIEKLIYPVGFYRQKAKRILSIAHLLLSQYQGKVPSDETKLRELPGVGHKTVALVQAEAFGIPALCVDTHVHRISNRLTLVNTTTAEHTERALKKILPPELWIDYSRLLVTWGQNRCIPIAPFCTECKKPTDICFQIDALMSKGA